MPYRISAFARLLEPINRRDLNNIVKRHGGNRGVGTGAKAWTCQRHLKTLLFAQFAGLGSLREIVQALSAQPDAQPDALYHLNLRLPKRSTLSDASCHRLSEVFADLCQVLIKQVTSGVRREASGIIELLDASPIQLKNLHHFNWPEKDSRTRGLKLYVHYDLENEYPVHFEITSPKVSDTNLVKEVTIKPGTTYVFDRGFTDYNWWYDLNEKGALFVTRLKSNAHRRDVQTNRKNITDTILEDNTLQLGQQKPRGGAENRLYNTPLREIVVEREGKPPLSLVTNDFQRSAQEIAQLYKQRWNIELFFKNIKQNLKIKTFLGRSENAVKIQIYVALIAFLLLKLFKETYAKASKISVKLLLSRLKVALLAPFNLTNKTKPPPKPPRYQCTKPQMELKWI